MDGNGVLKQILMGTAYGDALGEPLEFGGVPSAESWMRVLTDTEAHASDDTQMMLFLTESLKLWKADGGNKKSLRQEISRGYCRWYTTQTNTPNAMYDEGVLGYHEMWQRRAPGNTCMGSMAAICRQGKRSTNTSKGNGTVMRCAPIGILGAVWDMGPAWVIDTAVIDAQLTHDHHFAWQGSVYWSLLHFFLTRSPNLEEAMGRARMCMVAEGVNIDAFTKHTKENDAKFYQTRMQAQAWVAEEAVAIALRSVMGATSWLQAAKDAIHIVGDSDTVGSMAGGLAAHLFPIDIPDLKAVVDIQPVIDYVAAV